MRTLGIILLALSLGCGDDDVDTDAGADATTMDAPTPDAPTPDATTDTIPDAPMERVMELVGGGWELSGGSEGYVCATKTMEETVFIKEFRPVAPLGTHHTVLTVRAPGTAADGTFPCDAFTNAADMIFGSGVGTENLAFPEGVAIRVEAGQQLLLNLHLFNTDGSRLTGYSAIEGVLMDEADVEHEAEVVLAGSESFAIPARASDYEVDGRCTMTGETNLFAVMPHMHTFGTFMRVTAQPSGADPVILHEAFYSFDDQRYSTFDTLALGRGDRVDVNCRYDNPGDETVRYGDSTLSEMCYAAIYRYPAVPADGITCTN